MVGKAAVALLALTTAGCRGTLDACAALCFFGPDIVKEKLKDKPPPDTSTAHCDRLPGSVWVAENGDRFAFSAGTVEWRHGDAVETRGWRCDHDRRVLLAGFQRDWQGTLHFRENGMMQFVLQPFRVEGGGSTHVFPCELPIGRAYFTESGESLAFVDARTVRRGARTMSWRCAPGELTLEDGTKLVLGHEAKVLRMGDVTWALAVDGKRPPFPCDGLAGSRWRAPRGDTLAFGAKTVLWHQAHSLDFTMEWSCRESKVTVRSPSQRAETMDLFQNGIIFSGQRYEKSP